MRSIGPTILRWPGWRWSSAYIQRALMKPHRSAQRQCEEYRWSVEPRLLVVLATTAGQIQSGNGPSTPASRLPRLERMFQPVGYFWPIFSFLTSGSLRQRDCSWAPNRALAFVCANHSTATDASRLVLPHSGIQLVGSGRRSCRALAAAGAYGGPPAIESIRSRYRA